MHRVVLGGVLGGTLGLLPAAFVAGILAPGPPLLLAYIAVLLTIPFANLGVICGAALTMQAELRRMRLDFSEALLALPEAVADATRVP